MHKRSYWFHFIHTVRGLVWTEWNLTQYALKTDPKKHLYLTPRSTKCWNPWLIYKVEEENNSITVVKRKCWQNNVSYNFYTVMFSKVIFLLWNLFNLLVQVFRPALPSFLVHSQQHTSINVILVKLDGVGPIDNRPSTD